MHEVASWLIPAHRSAGNGDVRGSGEIGRSAEESVPVLQCLQHLTVCLPRRHLRAGLRDRDGVEDRHRLGGIGRLRTEHAGRRRARLQRLAARCDFWMLALPRGAPRIPARMQGAAALECPPRPRQRLLVDEIGELRVGREAERGLDGRHLVVAEAAGVSRRGAADDRRGPADDASQRDQRRNAVAPRSLAQRLLDRVEVARVVDLDHPPSVRPVPRPHVLSEREIGAAVDRDGVVVPDEHQVVEPERARQARRLARDALLHAAVAREHEHRRIPESGSAVVPRCIAPCRERQSDRTRHALPQRPC